MLELIEKIWNWVWSPTGLATIGGGVTIWQFLRSCHNNKLNNELTNTPEFYFVEPHKCHVFNNSDCAGGDFTPQISTGCDGSKRVYWFGLVNAGRFAAREVRIAIVKKSELADISNLSKNRWQTLDYWGGNNFQEVNNGEITALTTSIGDIKLGPGDDKLYVLLSYQSDYSNIKYKRLFEWCVVNNGTVERLYVNFYQDELKKANKELSQDGQLSNETQASLANIVLNNTNYSDEDFFSEMGFSRPVFLREVRTIKAISSNKVHWWTKAWTKLRCKVSRKITKDDWLKHF